MVRKTLIAALLVALVLPCSLALADGDDVYAKFEAALKKVEEERGQNADSMKALAEAAETAANDAGVQKDSKKYEKALIIALNANARGEAWDKVHGLAEAAAAEGKPALSVTAKMQIASVRAYAYRQTGDNENFQKFQTMARELQGAARAEAEAKKPKAGQMAPTFTLKDLDGKEVKLEELRGKIVLLDFWATWCGPCKAIMASFLKPLHEEFKARGVVVVGVGCNWNGDTAEKQKAFGKQMGYEWLKLYDADGSVTETYQVQGIPTLVLIDKEGKIVIYGGGRDQAAIRDYLEKNATPKDGGTDGQ